MRSASLRTLVILAALPLGLAACGGSSDLDDLAETLEEVAELTPEQAQCVATDLRAAAKYTEDQINDFADGEVENQEWAELLPEFENDVAVAITACL